MAINHIGKKVNIYGKLEGKIIDQNSFFILVKFDNGTKIVFNSQRLKKYEWVDNKLTKG